MLQLTAASCASFDERAALAGLRKLPKHLNYISTSTNKQGVPDISPFISAGGFAKVCHSFLGIHNDGGFDPHLMDLRLPANFQEHVLRINIRLHDGPAYLKELMKRIFSDHSKYSKFEHIVVVMGHTDQGFPSELNQPKLFADIVLNKSDEILKFIPKNMHIFVSNLDDYQGKLHQHVTAIPLGLTMGIWVTEQIHTMCRIINNVKNTPPIPTKWILAHFEENTNKKERQMAIEAIHRLQSTPNSHRDHKTTVTFGQDSHEHTLTVMLDYRFVLAPYGNGFDTHRILEALMLGRIPIVRWAPYVCAYEGLPVLRIQEWSDLTWEVLEKAWIRFQSEESVDNYDLQRMFMPYWKDRVSKYGHYSEEEKRWFS